METHNYDLTSPNLVLKNKMDKQFSHKTHKPKWSLFQKQQEKHDWTEWNNRLLYILIYHSIPLGANKTSYLVVSHSHTDALSAEWKRMKQCVLCIRSEIDLCSKAKQDEFRRRGESQQVMGNSNCGNGFLMFNCVKWMVLHFSSPPLDSTLLLQVVLPANNPYSFIQTIFQEKSRMSS